MTAKLLAMASACALAGAALSTSSLAGERSANANLAGETAAMKVKVGDLNVSSEYGAKAALARIKAASRAFCGQPDLLSLARRAEAQRCQEKMTYLAVSKLDAPVVTARYNGSGHAPSVQLARR